MQQNMLYILFILGFPLLFIGFFRPHTVGSELCKEIGYILLTATIGYTIFEKRKEEEKKIQHDILKTRYENQLKDILESRENVREKFIETCMTLLKYEGNIETRKKDCVINLDITKMDFINKDNPENSKKSSVILKTITEYIDKIQKDPHTLEDMKVMHNAHILHRNMIHIHLYIKKFLKIYDIYIQYTPDIQNKKLNEHPENTLGNFINLIEWLDMWIDIINLNTQFEHNLHLWAANQNIEYWAANQNIEYKDAKIFDSLRTIICSSTFIEGIRKNHEEFTRGILAIIFLLYNAQHIKNTMLNNDN